MPGEAVREEAGEIVEERVDHRLEAHQPASAVLGNASRKRTEALVLPEDVVPPLSAVSDSQPALARQTNELPVAKQRAEDHLELDGVRWDPMKRGAGMLDHTDEFDRGLRWPKGCFAIPSARARLGVAGGVPQADAAELERRLDHGIPERPETRLGAEDDPGGRMPADQVVDLDQL